MNKIIFTEQQKKEILDLYLNQKKSQKIIAEQFNVSRSVIKRILAENQIYGIKNNHKYNADYRKFETIDSAEKAYWLGFIAADGCNYIREDNASVIINISRQDKDHLVKFQKFMSSNVQIVDHVQTEGFSNNTLMSKIVFNSIDMAKDLNKLGITPRKSLTLKPPKIEEQYFLPFILGYFDGDGSLFKNNQNNSYGINIEGTKEVLEWINNILNIADHLEKRQNNDSNNYYIRCGGVDKPYQIMKKLYDSCLEHLDRKYNIFLNLQTVVLNRNIK